MFNSLAEIKDGTILRLNNCFLFFMKVCDKNGQGGLIELLTGRLIHNSELEYYHINIDKLKFAAENLDKFYYEEED